MLVFGCPQLFGDNRVWILVATCEIMRELRANAQSVRSVMSGGFSDSLGMGIVYRGVRRAAVLGMGFT
jgi:hypothetical protein